MDRELRVDQDIYETGHEPRFNPELIGYIGLENLKFARNVKDRKVQFDLNSQHENAEHKPYDGNPKLKNFLQFLLENEKRFNFIENDLEQAKFFCLRGYLTTISCTPYENTEPWKVVVILSKGSIYLVKRDTQYAINKQELEKVQPTGWSRQWGQKFEQFIVSDSPDSDPTPELPLVDGNDFLLVMKTRLNRHTIVYGAEVDGMQCEGPMPLPPVEQGPEAVVKYLSAQTFIELKTNRRLEFDKQIKNFRTYTTKKWWCQSFLIGIDTILCGFRNDGGIVEKLQVYPLQELVEEALRWEPCGILNFLDSFLTYVKECLSKEIEMKHGRRALKNLQSLPFITLVLEWEPTKPWEPKKPVQVTNNYDFMADPVFSQFFG